MSRQKYYLHRETDDTKHDWEKTNLITLSNSKGSWDEYKCNYCGIKVKQRTIGILEFETSSESKVLKFNNCPKAPKNLLSLDDEPWDEGAFIKITNLTFCSSEAMNLTRGSEHEIVSPAPEYAHKYTNSESTVWVMGRTEPVRLLQGEFIFLSE